MENNTKILIKFRFRKFFLLFYIRILDDTKMRVYFDLTLI